ncbi:MAG: ATP-binding protein [Ruminobacter sp.]|nr:ATP-binding protein [Ruminobacter sp.]
MQRTAILKLKEWKESKNHKPIIIEGARQVGKTWLMKEFGKQYYEQVVYLHFDNNQKLTALFENDYEIPRLIEAFEILSGIKINPDNTLIIFDEIQECPRALTSLKYFYENAPEYDIIAAGSLLGLMHHEGTGFPVGKVSFLNLYPMNFFEFARALGEEKLIELIEKKDFQMITVFKNDFEKLVKMYCYIGGMPEVVQNFVDNRNYKKVREIQKNILASYENDFSKHVSSNTVEKIRMLWRAIPSQLAKENKKFIYNVIKTGARAKEYELALLWLKDAGLVYQVNRIKKPDLPLIAYQDLDAFKLFIVDVGLLSALTNLDVKTILEKTQIFEEFKGAIAEQYVYQQLKSVDDIPIFYWSNDSSRSEIDFVIQHGEYVVPVEVKAEKNLKAKSLNNFIQEYKSKKSVRTSLADYKLNDNNLYDIPLYAISNIEEIIE